MDSSRQPASTLSSITSFNKYTNAFAATSGTTALPRLRSLSTRPGSSLVVPPTLGLTTLGSSQTCCASPGLAGQRLAWLSLPDLVRPESPGDCSVPSAQSWGCSRPCPPRPPLVSASSPHPPASASWPQLRSRCSAPGPSNPWRSESPNAGNPPLSPKSSSRLPQDSSRACLWLCLLRNP